MSRFLDEKNILTLRQHGFRSHHSCETQLILAIDDWAKALDSRKDSDIRLSKAFDSVPHRRFLTKIESYGTRCNANLDQVVSLQRAPACSHEWFTIIMAPSDLRGTTRNCPGATTFPPLHQWHCITHRIRHPPVCRRLYSTGKSHLVPTQPSCKKTLTNYMPGKLLGRCHSMPRNVTLWAYLVNDASHSWNTDSGRTS